MIFVSLNTISNKQSIIYVLIDPRTGEIRYIGKSTCGLKRPRDHTKPKTLKKNTAYCGNWLRQLVAAGLEPTIKVIEVCTRDQLAVSEKKWIARGRKLGWKLTNLTDGGDGTLGWKPSETTRANMSAARIKVFESPGMREKASRAQIQRAARTGESERRSAVASKMWEESRERLVAAISEERRSPEARARLSQNTKIAWQDADFRAKVTAASRERWQDADFRKKQIEILHEIHKRPEVRAKLSISQKARWTPERRAVQSAKLRATKSTPEAQARQSVAQKKRYGSVEERHKTGEAVRRGHAKHREELP